MELGETFVFKCLPDTAKKSACEKFADILKKVATA